MTDNKESFQENILIKRAKRRLLGALTILIILFILSIFFLQDRTEITTLNPIKISFLEVSKNNASNYQANITMNDHDLTDYSTDNPPEIQKKSSDNLSGPGNIESGQYFIQVGIFSNKENASKLLGVVKSLGYDARLELIDMSGKEKLKLTTTVFNSQTEAQFALSKLKSANLPGIIRQE